MSSAHTKTGAVGILGLQAGEDVKVELVHVPFSFCNTGLVDGLRSPSFCPIIPFMSHHFFLNTNTSTVCISTRWGVLLRPRR